VTKTARTFAFAARSLVRQPGRASVGILGIAAVGALLFDMLLLSRGLIVSFRDLLDSVGFDVRILATDSPILGGARIARVTPLVRQLAGLPEIAEVVPVRLVDAETAAPRDGSQTAAGPGSVAFSLLAMDPARHAWTVVAGRDLAARVAELEVLINRRLAGLLKASPGDTISIRVACAADRAALPPMNVRVSGIADFPFDDATQQTAVAPWRAVTSLCGLVDDAADLVLIASREGYGPDAAVSAIRRLRPDLRAATNEEVVTRMQQQGFSYFRQISTVLSTITMVFGFLLITVLLTVSVNQRLGEIAALRALGFSRARLAADVLWQSALLVGTGGFLALPLGAALSVWLDAILRQMPGIPASLHFFVYEPRALAVHVGLLVATAVLAALYPMRLVAALPIAATLRSEIVG